jgi:hypothetical protein
VAIGTEGTAVGGGAAEWNGARWAPEVIPGQAETTQTHWLGISCAPGTTICEAVGWEVSGKNNLIQPIVERRVGPGNWERQTFEVPVAEGQTHPFVVTAIDCISATSCVITGNAGFGSSYSILHPLVERWNGTKWQAELPPLPAGVEAGNLSSASCVSASFCTVAGETLTSIGVSTGLYVERWNGTAWSGEVIPSPPGNLPEAVDRATSISCASTTACEVVTRYTDSSKIKRLFAERWTGTKWETQILPNPEGAQPFFTLEPPAVSCPSTTMCELVGLSQESEPGSEVSTTRPKRPYAEQWNGTAWVEQVLPRPAVGGFRQGWMTSIDCVSTTACAAAGGSEIEGASQGEARGLAEVFLKSPAPTAVTKPASALAETGATLEGVADPNWLQGAGAYFEYGPTTSYGTSTASKALGVAEAQEQITQGVTGLQPGTTYHYRLVVTAGAQKVLGLDQTFQTTSAPPSPTAAQLVAMKTTDPFNGTTSAISNYKEKWTALPWDGTASPKGEDGAGGWGPVEAFPSVAGASYGPVANFPGAPTAVAATMQTSPELVERYFALWLDLPPNPTVKAGYQLKFYVSGTNKFKVSLIKWSGGTPTTLKEATNVSFVNGNSLALVDEGTEVSAWINTGSGFTKLLGADLTTNGDPEQLSGTAAVEGSGNYTRLTNLRFGALQPKVTGMSAAIGGLRLEDEFATAESPLSEGGFWAALSWDYSGSGHSTGRVANGWSPYDAFASGINGAYWTRWSLADTGSGDGVAATLTGNPGAERHFELLLDMQNPGTVRSGYELRFTETASNVYTVSVSKWVAGTATPLASKAGVSFVKGSRFALTDQVGTLAAWTAGASGEYTQLLTANDPTFTIGYVGVAGAGNGTRLSNFRGGPLAPF